MSAVIVHDLTVCSDCLLFIANGDEPIDNQDWQFDPDYDGDWHICAGDSANDEEFSSYRCDTCHTGLAGARHSAHAICRA